MSRQNQRPTEAVQRRTLTKKEAAASLGVSVDTFERRVQPFIKVILCGQLVLVPVAEIDKWVRVSARQLAVPDRSRIEKQRERAERRESRDPRPRSRKGVNVN